MYLWICGNLEFRFVSIRCCVWIGALDLVDLDLLESGQPMNVLMFREGVGCSDCNFPRVAGLMKEEHMRSRGDGKRSPPSYTILEPSPAQLLESLRPNEKALQGSRMRQA